MVGRVKKWTSGAWNSAKNLFGSDKPPKGSHSLKEREANIPKALKPTRQYRRYKSLNTTNHKQPLTR